jgi:hypothetical protein
MSNKKKTNATHAAATPAGKKADKGPHEPSNAIPAPSHASSGIFVKEVRVRNYRCLRAVDVELDPLTVLIGQNHSGKTTF